MCVHIRRSGSWDFFQLGFRSCFHLGWRNKCGKVVLRAFSACTCAQIILCDTAAVGTHASCIQIGHQVAEYFGKAAVGIPGRFQQARGASLLHVLHIDMSNMVPWGLASDRTA